MSTPITRITNPEMMQGILDCWKSYRDSGGDYRTAQGIIFNDSLGRFEVQVGAPNSDWDFWTWLMSCLPPERFPDPISVLNGYTPATPTSPVVASTPTVSGDQIPVIPEQVRLSDIVQGTGIETTPAPPRRQSVMPPASPATVTPPVLTPPPAPSHPVATSTPVTQAAPPVAPVLNTTPPAVTPQYSQPLEDSATGFLDLSEEARGGYYIKNISSNERIDIPEFPFIVGRSSKSSAKSLGLDEMLSRQHCSLRSTPQGLEVIDLGSRNGTFLGSHRLTPHQVTIAAQGTIIRLGTLTFTVEKD